ncbi:liprin-beta-2b [Aplochiton taeniatus]
METNYNQPSHMLEAALDQMDDIIAGSKAAAEYTNRLYNLGSTVSTGTLQVVQIAEDLKLALEHHTDQEERDCLRAELLNLCSPVSNEHYQDRLLQLEGDKESLVLQVSVLTDQVEAQGEKIRDLESSLEEHYLKLVSTEEMLQQELLSRTSLETQKLDLMDEVSCLKLKLVGIEDTHTHQPDSSDQQQNKVECVVNLISELQEQMCKFQEEITYRILEKRALEARQAQGEKVTLQVQEQSTDPGLAELGLIGASSHLKDYNCGGQNQGILLELQRLKSKVEELEEDKSQYEKSLRAAKLSISYSLHVCYQSVVNQLASLKLTGDHCQLGKHNWEERWPAEQQLLTIKDREIQSLHQELLATAATTIDNTDRDQEFQRLKIRMESLITTNNEKDRHIKELTVLLSHFRQMKEVLAHAQAGSSEEEPSGSLKLRALTNKDHSDMLLRPEISSRGSSPLLVSSSSFHSALDFSCSGHQNSMDTSMVSPGERSFLNGAWHLPRIKSSSLEELQKSLPKPVEDQPVEPVPKQTSCPTESNGQRHEQSTLDAESADPSGFTHPVAPPGLLLGFRHGSASPASAGFFFISNQVEGLRPCIDYRGLNSVTVKYRLPSLHEYGLLSCYVVVYLVSHLIYSQHIRQVIRRLLEHQLYVKGEKCKFHVLPRLCDQTIRVQPIATPYSHHLGTKLGWNEATTSTFGRIKEHFTPILTHPDPAQQFVVEVDASETGMVSCLQCYAALSLVKKVLKNVKASVLQGTEWHNTKEVRSRPVIHPTETKPTPLSNHLIELTCCNLVICQRNASSPPQSCSCAGHSDKEEGSTLQYPSPLSSKLESEEQASVSSEHRKNHRGLLKLWGKIRHSQSGSPPGEYPDHGEFRRGGVRSTAGPRLACTGDTSALDLTTPFSKWTIEKVCDWLEECGLGQYVILARQWVASGQTLLSASPEDLEKEMGLKNPLHRKKVQLAIKSLSTNQTEMYSGLDHHWVTRWLDDIGLPQYKDQFNEGRVDGRMLRYLTLNDLLHLKVTSQLHHLSIKSAIHVLHVNKFNPWCLKRRPGDENMTSPSEVLQWSNHRVMEWLRSVDLAEYAPNLRGSGVHGGLIILEPRFSSDTMAMLLSIPHQKTLLRRHLATNFSCLVGQQAQQEKREYMESAGCQTLSTTAKVRPKKLGFSSFGHLRGRRTDNSTDYIFSIEASQDQDLNQAIDNSFQLPYTAFRALSPILDRESEHNRDQVGI